MKERYIDLMERTLAAYADEQIVAYFERVKRDGLTEHGFPRMAANIGILISHGRRTDLMPLFLKMMDFCCLEIPRVKAANDFSVREIVCALMEIEAAGVVPQKRLEGWKRSIASIDPYTCYDKYAKSKTDKVFNWALFTTVSEYARHHYGLCNADDFVDVQIPTQLQWLDENGMYRDALYHPPIIYDLVPRGLFSLLLHFGYDGPYRAEIDEMLRKTELLTLKMQSVTGEVPFGGRSNQFLHNEAMQLIVLEYAADRYQREGNFKLAGKFKAAAERALDCIERWLDRTPVHHVKNRFPLESRFGCEVYAYFDKYMITLASNLYNAYILCNDDVVPGEIDLSPMVYQTSEYFNKVFLRAGGYSLEFDTDADPHYDASGLGRVHKADVPSALCMSLPCPAMPKFVVGEHPVAMSLSPGIFSDNYWQFATDAYIGRYEVLGMEAGENSASASLLCRFFNGKEVRTDYVVDQSGVTIKATSSDKLAHMLPAFAFDGEVYTNIKASEQQLEIRYQGFVCRYTTSGKIIDLEEVGYNRNGHYRGFAAIGNKEIEIKIELEKE
ncbi:MAG: hypothetical protein IKB41_05445 [Clostridia bacterium]|nr:hypothetical protein [Clostridia bacterium]